MDFVVHKKNVGADVLVELHEIISVVFNLQPILISLEIIERNHLELIAALEAHQRTLNNLATSNEVSIPQALEGVILSGQKISNFLSSASAFLAQTDRQLLILHGEDSPELNMWNERRKNLHASYFSYQFLYELRNYVQHRSLPLSNFNISGERSTENAPMIFKTGITILRDKLFDDGYDWKKIKKEIQKQHIEFDLLPLTTEYLHCLRQLGLEALKLQNIKLVECARYFEVMRRTLKIPVDAVPVIFVGESINKHEPPSRFEIIPVEQFAYVLKRYNELLNTCEN